MRSFESGRIGQHHDEVADTPTYLLARDEDCENSFHSTADFVSCLSPTTAATTIFTTVATIDYCHLHKTDQLISYALFLV